MQENIRVIQFGEGNFLRGFVDYFLFKLKEKNICNSDVVVVQPLREGMCKILKEQDCNYNLYLRGIQDKKIVSEHSYIDIISDCVNPYEDYESYINLAKDKKIKFIVSNTTESGIEFDDTNKFEDRPAKSFPGKLTQLLYARYKENLDGFIILSCELIDNNGDELKKCVIKYSDFWNLGEDFKKWILEKNTFCSTLVDRIVTGYPKDEKELEKFREELGYDDRCLDTAEIFHQWVIDGDFEEILPFRKAGFNVIWTDDVGPYKKRKVRILNGAHTSMVLGARLYGLNTVDECLKDDTINTFLNRCIFDEIIPTLGSNKDDINFGNDVIDRFSNPFIKHQLLSIALNSVSKFDVRVLPTIIEYKEKYKVYPKALSFSLAALIKFYKGDEANDSEYVMEFMKKSTVKEILDSNLWHTNISDMYDIVNNYYDIISNYGIKVAFNKLLKED